MLLKIDKTKLANLSDHQKVILSDYNCIDQELTIELLNRVLTDSRFTWFINIFIPDFPTHMTSALIRKASKAADRAIKNVEKEYQLAWHKQGKIENKWVEIRDKYFTALKIAIDAQYQIDYKEIGQTQYYESAEPADQRRSKQLANREVRIKREVLNLRYEFATEDATDQANDQANAAWEGKLPAQLRRELANEFTAEKEKASNKARSKYLPELLKIIESIAAEQ